MRGRPNPQRSMLAIVDLEARVPQDHPLRRVKEVADAALARLSPVFDRMYAQVGRASVPPERLLKASLLIALYSVRSERAFCEELEYNLLYRWFLDMDLMERSFDATVFTKNRQRLLAHDTGRALFDEVVWAADAEGLLSDEHFSVDGTLLEAAASLKSFRSKEGSPPPVDDDPGNPSVDFRGERRCNEGRGGCGARRAATAVPGSAARRLGSGRCQPAGAFEGGQAAGGLFASGGAASGSVVARSTASRARAQRTSVTWRCQPVALRTS